MVELVAALAPRGDQPRGLEHLDMLRERLPGQREPVVHREAAAQLEERLPVALAQFIEDGSPCRRAERFEDVGHAGC